MSSVRCLEIPTSRDQSFISPFNYPCEYTRDTRSGGICFDFVAIQLIFMNGFVHFMVECWAQLPVHESVGGPMPHNMRETITIHICWVSAIFPRKWALSFSRQSFNVIANKLPCRNEIKPYIDNKRIKKNKVKCNKIQPATINSFTLYSKRRKGKMGENYRDGHYNATPDNKHMLQFEELRLTSYKLR